MVQVHYLSDPHFGHKFVARLRGFDSVEEHDAEIATNWRRVVKPDDIVWVLGDLSVHAPEHALDFTIELPGRKQLVAGNHDQCHPMNRAAWKWQRRYLNVFESVQAFARRRINEQEVMLSHFPYTKDRHQARFMQYRLRDEGKWLLHGHTHDKDQRREGREIHVGLDAWDLTPVSENTIRDLMQE